MDGKAARIEAPEDFNLFAGGALRDAGFKGFVSFRELHDGQIENVPKTGGVYVVMRLSDDLPIYLEQSVGRSGWPDHASSTSGRATTYDAGYASS